MKVTRDYQLITTAQDLFSKFVIWFFVNNVGLHKFWACHRLSERSFFIRGRQFHVCARCTGLITGLPCSIILIPWHQYMPYVLGIFTILLVADGVTQLLKWRVSNNKLRFFTGLGTAISFLPSLITIGGY